MNKLELANALSAKMNITQTESLRFITSFVEVIGEELSNEGNILLKGFGTFSLWSQAGRLGRNPKTGESVPIHPRTSVKFKPGVCLLDKINKG